MATTWNPSDKGSGVTLSGGNLAASIAATNTSGARATASEASGKWYFEVLITSGSGAGFNMGVGVMNATAGVAAGSTFFGGDANGLSYRGSDGAVKFNATTFATGATFGSGDTIGVAFDATGRTVSFYKNNVLQSTVTSGSVPTGALFPAVGGQNAGTISAGTANFGASTFAFTPPAGYNGIDTPVNGTGTSTATREKITAASAGVTSSGLSSASRQNIAAAGTGVNSSGTSAQTLQNITAAGATLPVFASVQVLQNIVVGPSLPILASAQALQGIAATGAGYVYQGSFLPSVIATGIGTESQDGRSTQALQGVTAAGTTVPTAVSVVSRSPAVIAASRGVEGAVGVSSAVRQAFSASGAGGFVAVGKSAMSLATINASSRGYFGTGASFSAIVMHTESQALWTYTNFVFNSFARFNGQILAGSDGGLFQLAGDTDNGVAIDASARTGTTDFNTSHLKRVERVYLGYRAAGEMILRVRTDETNVRDYLVPRTAYAGLHGNHVKLGRGLDARYWQFEVRNRNGSSFSLNMLECKPIVLKRRIGRNDA